MINIQQNSSFYRNDGTHYTSLSILALVIKAEFTLDTE
jgi:hypothetical protein